MLSLETAMNTQYQPDENGKYRSDLCGFCDNAGNCWFLLITPQFATNRSGIGIHPDGRNKGTKGCIGIDKAILSSFIRKELDDFIKKFGSLRVEVEE